MGCQLYHHPHLNIVTICSSYPFDFHGPAESAIWAWQIWNRILPFHLFSSRTPTLAGISFYYDSNTHFSITRSLLCLIRTDVSYWHFPFAFHLSFWYEKTVPFFPFLHTLVLVQIEMTDNVAKKAEAVDNVVNSNSTSFISRDTNLWVNMRRRFFDVFNFPCESIFGPERQLLGAAFAINLPGAELQSLLQLQQL